MFTERRSRARESAPLGADDVRDAIETLTGRVETLSAIVRETAGSLAANRGDVAALDRRLQERLGAETQRAGATLATISGELEALRTFVAENREGRGSDAVASAAADPLRETVSTLADRVETLSGFVRETAGRLAAEDGQISTLRELLAAGDAHLDARLGELRDELQSVSEVAARAARSASAAPAPHPSADAELESRVEKHVGALADRIDFLSGTVSETAGRLTAKEGELVGLERRLDQRSANALELAERLRLDVERLGDRLTVDPLLQERVERLAGAVQAVGDRVGTLSGIVGETAGRVAGREDLVAALDERLNEVGDRVSQVAGELHREIEALAADVPGEGATSGERALAQERLAAFGDRLTRLEGAVGDISGTAEQVGTGLRAEFIALTEATESAQALAAHDSERVGQALVTLQGRLERLELDRLAMASGATAADGAWAQERVAIESRLDAIAAKIMAEPGLDSAADSLVAELAARLERIESERETVADLAVLADNWTTELSALEARVDELSVTPIGSPGLSDSELEPVLAELQRRVGRIELDRDTVTAHLAHATTVWEEDRNALDRRMDELAASAFAASERGSAEISHALATLTGRLEQLEHDRRAVTSGATAAERAWVEERSALEIRLDAIAATIGEAPGHDPEVGRLVHELAGRLERVESDRETVADLAALADNWKAELVTLESRVDELSSAAPSRAAGDELDAVLSELQCRIDRIERDRDAVGAELARASTAWASERASLQERVSELAARIVTGPMSDDVGSSPGEAFLQAPQELDRLRIGIEGLRMRLAYHEKTVAELAGSKSVTQRLDELASRLDQLSAIVAAGMSGSAAPTARIAVLAPEAYDPETSGLLSRLDETERIAKRNREAVLESLEKIASRMDWRLQRLETSDTAGSRS